MYTIAKEAARRKLWNAAVVFFQIILSQAKIDLRKQRKQNISDTLQLERKEKQFLKAMKVVQKAKNEHDLCLLHKGPLTKKSRCNFQPFNSKLNESDKLEQLENPAPILDRDALFYYSEGSRKSRRDKGRLKWIEDTKLNKTEEHYFTSAAISQSDSLCVASQIRVIR